MASALTKPVITDRDTNFISRPSRKHPGGDLEDTHENRGREQILQAVFADQCVIMRTAVDAVAAEIIAGRPPTMAVTQAIENEA